MFSTNAPSTITPSSYGYDCAVLAKLPYGGTEILYATSFFLILILMWGLVYADIVFKQLFSSFIDPTVLQLIAQVKKLLPNLDLTPEQKKLLYRESEMLLTDVDCNKCGVKLPVKSHYALTTDGTPVQYDAVAAQESYIASKTIDLDMLTILLNNNNFSTMSEYSADTVRGYNMLSVMLTASAFTLTFMSLHNFYVDPRAIAPGLFGISWGVIAVFFYPGLLFTAIIMTGPSGIVQRQSNICLVTNIPSQLNGSGNPLLKLHVAGVVLFAIPTIIHTCQLIAWGQPTMPNYETEVTLLLVVLAGALTFGLGSIWTKIFPTSPRTTANNISITGEWAMMITCFLSCAHWEGYATMYCSGNTTYFNSMLFGAFFAPFALVARNQLWSPTTFATLPSLLLIRNGTPVATFGPCPVESYHGEDVPNTQSKQWGTNGASTLPHVAAV